MSDQNLTDNTRPARVCGSPDCLTCATVELGNFTGRGLSGMTADGSIFAPAGLGGSFISITNPPAAAPEPQLTVKQAAKAYRKAVRAAEQADADADAARAASRAANDARDKAHDAARAAREALEKAASQ